MPALSAPEAARHFIALSHANAPAVAAEGLIPLLPPAFAARHPAAPDETAQGFLACLHELQEMQRAATGMEAVSLAPQTEGQAVLACLLMLRAYHDARGDAQRTELLICAPPSANVIHAAAQSGFELREVAANRVTLAAAGLNAAALLITDEGGAGMASVAREAGVPCGYLGEIACAAACGAGFDVMGFSLTDGEAEPQAWSVAASKTLAHFLPLPVVRRTKHDFRLLAEKDLPLSIGRLSAGLGHGAWLFSSYVHLRAARHPPAFSG